MRAILAQVVTEAKIRLRSTSTIFAVLGVFALTFLYLPDPSANRVSISWRATDGTLMSGTYDAAYVGAVIGMLSSLFLTLIGFYLVAGSIRRDRQRHVLEIIAATPVSRLQFITGKWLAHFAYLLIIASTSVAAGIVLFFRFGEGPVRIDQFMIPWLVTVPGAMAFTAAAAVLFDVTPVLRSRLGWVIWFFAWTFLFMFIPASLAGRMGPNPTPRPTNYDPAGLMAFEEMVEASMSESVKNLSMGVMIIDEPVTRVPIGTMHASALLKPSIWWNIVWVGLVVGTSGAIFRFRSSPMRERAGRRPSAVELTDVAADASSPQWSPAGGRRASTSRAVLAEARLMWQAAGLLKWPFILCTILVLFIPLSSASGVAAIALLLFGPIISEVAARESIHGTTSLVRSSPSVPGSMVLWKLVAVALFALVALGPVLVRAFLASGNRGVVFVTGIAGTIALATGLGSLTSGGKFFTGVYVVAWYMATQRDAALDFLGWFAPEPEIATAGVWLAAGAAAVVAAWAREVALERSAGF